MMHRLAALVIASFASSVFALGLGEVEGRAVIGQTLNVSIPILGSSGVSAQSACASLLPEGDYDRSNVIGIRLEGRRLHLTTRKAVFNPILQFRLRLGCSESFERSFVLLPEAPSRVSAHVPAGISLVPSEARKVLSNAPVGEALAGPAMMVLTKSDSLRMLSRQRYPKNSRARVRFIRLLAAANPDIFASEKDAFDQRLAAGTKLRVPEGLPALPSSYGKAKAKSNAKTKAKTKDSGTRTTQVRRKVAPVVMANPKTQKGSKPGRLVIGAGGASPASSAELDDSIDRLISVMNAQIEVQIAMTQRIKKAEEDLAELKRQLLAERQQAQRIKSELKAAREEAERSATVQLALVILLAGLGGAWLLNWMARRKAATYAVSVGSSVSHISDPPAVGYPTSAVESPDLFTMNGVAGAGTGASPEPDPSTQTLPLAFDSLFDEREDILPSDDKR